MARKCMMCGDTIDKRYVVCWKKGRRGIRHYPECITEPEEDKTELRIADDSFEDYLKK